MTAAELNTSKAKCYALALLRIAELERQLEKARHVTTTCPHCKTQYEHTLPSNAPDSQIDKALGVDWPVKSSATPEELAFIRELQHFYCDNIVDGVPTGDWHINHTPEQAARLLRVHVACAIREQQENHALQLGDLYRENSALRTALEDIRVAAHCISKAGPLHTKTLQEAWSKFDQLSVMAGAGGRRLDGKA